MTLEITDIIALMWVAVGGVISHELAHWTVWIIAGRKPRFDFFALEVEPRAGPSHTSYWDRVAAAAPYVAGCTCVLIGVIEPRVSLIIYGVAMVQIPSRVDVAAMRGKAEWIGLSYPVRTLGL